jgi:hypothetical protein
LGARTKEAYATHVGAYGAWLAGRRDGGVALGEPRARDYAARDFKRHLKVDRRWKPASVNLALAAVDHFNRFLGLGPANVKREPLAQAAPRALSEDEQRGRRALAGLDPVPANAQGSTLYAIAPDPAPAPRSRPGWSGRRARPLPYSRCSSSSESLRIHGDAINPRRPPASARGRNRLPAARAKRFINGGRQRYTPFPMPKGRYADSVARFWTFR